MVLKVYNALCNYYGIGLGSGLDASFAFDISEFCSQFKLPILISYNSLKILQQAGYIELTDEQENSSRVLFTVNKDDLYLQKHSAEQEKLIHVLLRSYTGLFTDPAYINEQILAKRLGTKADDIYNRLILLSKERIIQYIPRKRTAFLSFTAEREATNRIIITKEAYDDRRERYISRIKSILDYSKEENICRSQMLLSYFGEKDSKPCGLCDICRKKKETDIELTEFNEIMNDIHSQLSTEPLTVNQLTKKVKYKESKTTQVIRFMLDNNSIVENKQYKLEIKR
jgi:ATP-dependent DNA helicase RecQ